MTTIKVKTKDDEIGYVSVENWTNLYPVRY
ncbi:MAG: hypothetical protein CEN91_57 [Candidatus Berkelbacteria bacterium Licking1014_85]|uniref:Uncharacterized protein n=1 Tax=Candidatus Berkelbacteria bacterium Licking1014_85 TaxID=2017148 RepID=A0A554LMC1_9BACT|nr:MAG: hypothetical protein CEN91_57 [Candidatus Berkelbacteria bacterium Licking1014_85]